MKTETVRANLSTAECFMADVTVIGVVRCFCCCHIRSAWFYSPLIFPYLLYFISWFILLRTHSHIYGWSGALFMRAGLLRCCRGGGSFLQIAASLAIDGYRLWRRRWPWWWWLLASLCVALHSHKIMQCWTIVPIHRFCFANRLTLSSAFDALNFS